MRDPGQIAVLGVTGYSGLELAQLLLRHPSAKSVVFYVRDTQGAKCLSELFPRFRGWGNAPVRQLSDEDPIASSAGTAFLATPHETSATLVPSLLQAGMRVVDLSGAFRFKSEETFRSWYKLPAPPKFLLERAVYGLPE